MSYELWSLTSRNLMHSFDTEAEAIEAARTYLVAGDLLPSSLAIVVCDESDLSVRSVTGADLAAWMGGDGAGRCNH